MGPILKINNIVLELEQGFSDGYHNNMNPSVKDKMLYRTHPPVFLWDGGYFKNMSIDLNLVVGVQSILVTPQDLIDKLAELYSYALVDTTLRPTLPPITTISVGSWFKRRGYILDIDSKFEPPWEINTGMPMRAAVKLEFTPDFLAGQINVDSTLTPQSQDMLAQKFLVDGPARAQMSGASGGASQYSKLFSGPFGNLYENR